MTENPEPTQKRAWTEELEVAGNELVQRIQELVHQGNIRRLTIKQDDRVLLEVPLTIAAVAGAASVIWAPVLAALGALAALVARVTIVIEREEEGESGEGEEVPPTTKVEVEGEDE
jgi:hypothetical protein